MSGRYGVGGWDPATAFNARHGGGFAHQMIANQIEEAHRTHLAGEDWPDDPHPEGCFFCGGFEHPTSRH